MTVGRANRPTRSIPPASVRVGDVALIRYPHVANSRWMIVDYVVGFGTPHIWSGRWAFGRDAGTWTTHAATDATYTVKDRRDAARDAGRLAALPRNTHV